MSDQLDVIVRFHDYARLPELTRCIFSLVGQTYRPLRIILALQRFSPDDIAATRASLDPFVGGRDGVHLSVVNWELPEPADARAILLNIGLSVVQGRYLAFLDYDDVLYPEAYSLLVSQLIKGGAAIAFAAVRVVKIQMYDRYSYAAELVVPPYGGATLLDLFRANFCPLHSYAIDRTRVAAEQLVFSSGLTMEEDYEFLLRICASHVSDFTLLDTKIGDYYYKTDGSNTVSTVGGPPRPGLRRYGAIQSLIEDRRQHTVLASAVQRSLGFAAVSPSMTIRQAIERMPTRTQVPA